MLSNKRKDMEIRLGSKHLERVLPDFPRTLDKKRFCDVFNPLAERFLFYAVQDNERALARISHLLAQMSVDSKCFIVSENGKEQGKYRGRGFIRCKGIDDYLALSSWWYGDTRLAEMPQIVTDHIEMRFVAAFWKWNARGCNAMADKNKYKEITITLHGGGTPDYVKRVLETERIRKALRHIYGWYKE